MTQHFNRLSPAEAERLAFLAEEMAEATQIIGKILRHGYESCDPTWRGPEDERPPTNRELLQKEMGDVQCALDLMMVDLHGQSIARRCADKHRSVQQWMHHQPKVPHDP